MDLSQRIKSLERRRIISRKPHPVIPFILAFAFLLLGIVVPYIGIDKTFSYALFSLAGFTFIFAVLHLIVVKTLEKS